MARVSPLILGVILTVVSLCEAGEKLYDVIPEKVEVVKCDGDWFNIINMEVSKYNRTRYCINMEIEILQDFPEDAICSVDSYEKYGTRYGKSIFSLPVMNCCEFLQTDTFFIPSLKASGFLHDCPLKKGTYTLQQWYPDMTNAPVIVPGVYWRADGTIKTSDGQIILQTSLYLKIDQSKTFKLG